MSSKWMILIGALLEDILDCDFIDSDILILIYDDKFYCFGS